MVERFGRGEEPVDLGNASLVELLAFVTAFGPAAQMGMRYSGGYSAHNHWGQAKRRGSRYACKPASEMSRAAGTKHLTAVEIELQHPAVRFTVAVSDPRFRGLNDRRRPISKCCSSRRSGITPDNFRLSPGKKDFTALRAYEPASRDPRPQ